MATPPDLESLYREARADLATADPGTVIKWSFLVAKYHGRLALATARMRELEADRAYVRTHARTLRDNPGLTGGAADLAKHLGDEYELANEPGPAAGNVEGEYATATELLAAAQGVRNQLAARTLAIQMPPLHVVQGGKR